MPDGSLEEYEVDKFSQEGQRNFYLLGKVEQRLQETSDSYLILKESESMLIEKIKQELSKDNMVQGATDGDQDGKDKD